MKAKWFSLTLVVAMLVIAVVPMVGAAPANVGQDDNNVRKVDFHVDPLTKAQLEAKETAIDAVLHGKAFGKTHEVARGQFVELVREGEDPVWTLLGEFSDLPHNNIAEPDRSVDNTTYWVDDFSRQHYLDLLFDEGKGVNSMRQWYLENSANRYTVYGDVPEWVSLPNTGAYYDDDGANFAEFFVDVVNGWYDAQIAAGMTPAEIDEYLSGFDVWDRYDWDQDGNFNEPDGYIDHMNFVHAGEGEEAGGGVLGGQAIWSHSSFTGFGGVGTEGPSPDFLIGGIQIGNSSFWVNKYIINPENGGVGVFSHEYGHDLGLPDLYDYTGENATGFWTVMSSGSWLSQNPNYIGSHPDHFGLWEKLQLGWLSGPQGQFYDVAFAGAKSSHKLGPAEYTTKQAQGLFVVLPPKGVTEQIAEPYSGSHFYYSDSGSNLDNYMYKSFNLAAGSSLTAKANVQIELDWDYAYLIVSTDGGATWENVETNLSTNYDPNNQNFGFGITGNSGGWVDLTADLSAYTGDVLLGFRYWTDPFENPAGFMVDDIVVTGYPLDDAESDAGWTFDGFRLTTGSEFAFYSNYYVVENRQYLGYDAGLATAYNFVGGNWAERFPYQNGVLISYWDNSFDNNNVGAHCAAGRCGGLVLPIDSHPDALYCEDGSVFRNRVQTFDATFGLEATDQVTLHCHGEASTLPSLPAVRLFDDTNSYYDTANPTGSVIVPNTGTQIFIQSVSTAGGFVQVQVRPSK